MIPKKIHYCWFGKNELPTKAKKCIASWKKYCPDYEIVEWNEDPAVFIANALNPAQVMDVIFDETNPKACTVVVPDYQLSLAIGKRGQNARLAAKLTNHKIDIKSESDMTEFYENQEQQKETEELHDEAIVQSDLTDDEYETIAFNNETVEEKPEA